MNKVLISIFFSLFLGGCCKRVCENITVTKLGGCAETGYCGVMYSDGTFGREFGPVVGQPILKCRKVNHEEL